MADQFSEHPISCKQTKAGANGSASGAERGIGLRTPSPVADSLLAIAAIADAESLNALLGLAAAPPGAVRRRGNSRTAERIRPVDTLRCRVIWRLVAELFAMASDRDLPEVAARRRPRCHIRQIAMYLSHVVLSVPYGSIAQAFGRDRTTVVHACAVVEDRRDDAGYDRFVERCERCVEAVFQPGEAGHADG